MSGRQRLWEQAVTPVSPHPGRAHLPPSSHTSARVLPCTHPAPWDAWGAHGAACLMMGQGLLPAGSPGTGTVLLLLCRGERLHRSVAWLGREGPLHWLRGHERALTYHSGQRERGWERPCTENPPITQDTQITNGKTRPGGSGDEELETNSSVEDMPGPLEWGAWTRS